MAYQKTKMVDVSNRELRCADCGTEIRELPFEPDADRPVSCMDCARKRRRPRRPGRPGRPR